MLSPFVYALFCRIALFGPFFRFPTTSVVLIQVYACLVPVLEQQTVEEGFTVIHGEELMLDINTGTGTGQYLT